MTTGRSESLDERAALALRRLLLVLSRRGGGALSLGDCSWLLISRR